MDDADKMTVLLSGKPTCEKKNTGFAEKEARKINHEVMRRLNKTGRGK